MKFVKVYDERYIHYIPEETLTANRISSELERIMLSYLSIERDTGEIVKNRVEVELEEAMDKVFGIAGD